MDDKKIVSKMNEFLYNATKELSTWLSQMLPRVSDEWWQECVLSNLSYAQRELAEANNFTKIEQFDLAALLRIGMICVHLLIFLHRKENALRLC